MKSITTLEEKIEKLTKQKEALTRKISLSLYNDLNKRLGEDFSPELVLSIISDTWEKADDKTKEGWINSAKTFQNKRRRRPKKT